MYRGSIEYSQMQQIHEPIPKQNRPATSSIRGSFSNLEELAAAAGVWGLDWVQLDRGPLRARFQQTQVPSILASRFDFNRKFFQKGTVPLGMRTYGVIGPRSTRVEWRGIDGLQHHVVVFPSNDEFEFLSHPGFSGDTLSLPEERLFEVADRLGLLESLEGLPNKQALLDSDPARVEGFRRRLDKLHFLAETSAHQTVNESVVADAEFEVIAALVETLSSGRSDDDGRPGLCLRSRAFSIALDYIEDHASNPPSIEEICHASGVSWRTLNYAFRERFDLTPKQYLQAVRLNKVRRELLRRGSEGAISTIAAEWGFWHMGQFAKDYRRQFGELPSETAGEGREVLVR
jgi:AraC family transcriptional regulator, ethanolamine operon transcriptional activator